MNLKTTLLPYQEKAVEKLYHLRIGALYMEMGTGKTRTALEIVYRRIEAGKLDRVIWLCPCSVKVNLQADLTKHSDGWEKYITICGIETLSTSARENARLRELAQSATTMLIVDESNLVKNPHALRSEHITTIAEMCRYRMILNGTPVSRNEADLFQQWFILDWRVLGYKSYYSFAANHLEYDERFSGRIRRVLNVGYLTDKIAPYSVHIRKDECLELPDKEYHGQSYWLTPAQEVHYNDVLDRYLDAVNLNYDDHTSVWIYKALNAAQQIASGERVLSKPEDAFQHESFFQDPEENPRMQALQELIDAVGDEKAVVWCRYQHEIDAVMSMLGDRAVEFTGNQPMKKRLENLELFKGGKQFLAANKACAGYGLNLQFCHNAIYYTNDWDWATREQSEDRLHRIGQTEPVQIWDISAINTIDGRVIRCLTRKENMVDSFKAHLHDKNFAEWLKGKEEGDLNDLHRPDGTPEANGDNPVCP